MLAWQSENYTVIFYETPRCNLLKVFYLLLVDLLSEEGNVSDILSWLSTVSFVLLA